MICKNCFNELSKKDRVMCSICNSDIHAECAIKDGGIFCDTCYTEKDKEKETIQSNVKIPEVIRRSYIETYSTCPYKFLKEVIEGVGDDSEKIYAKIGIDLHDLFDKASNDTSYTIDLMYKDYKELFNKYPEDIFDSIIGSATKEDMYKRGLESIETFYHVISDMPKPYCTERTIQFSVGEDLPLVQTTSDRINLIDGELEVLDWKTGNVMVGKALSTDLQAPLYIIGVKKEFNLPVRKFTLYYLKENKTRVFERIDEDNYVCMVGKREYKINLQDTIRRVQHLFSQIKNGNFNVPINTKGMYFACKLCSVKQKGMCEGADIQSWQQFQ